MDEILQAVSNVGFPIAVTIYLLIRDRDNMAIISELKSAIIELTTYIKGGRHDD